MSSGIQAATLDSRARCAEVRRGAAAVLGGGLLSLAVFGLAMLARSTAPVAGVSDPVPISGLFKVTNVWQIHLTFTPDQWEAMEPKGGVGSFGGRGGPGGPGRDGPGGFGPGGGRPGGPGGFGPAMFIAPVFLGQGDSNQDGRLSQAEFAALGQKWFQACDTNATGKLDAGKLRAGLNATLTAPAAGPMGPGGRGGPGEPGGPRGRMGGPPLQGAEGKRNGLASAMGVEFTYVHADLDFAGRTFKDVAVRYKGNGTFMESRGSLKRSLKVQLDRFVPGRKLAGVTTLNLHNCVTDASWMNEVLSHRLFRDAGVPASRTAYAQVYFNVAGRYTNQYVGLYSVVENVDNRLAWDRFGTKKGALFKPVTRQLFEDMGDDWAAYRQTYDPKTPVSAEEAGRVIAFSQLVSHASDAEFAARLPEFLDLDEFARFMAVTTWLSTLDSILRMGQNYLVYLHPKTRQFQFIPWDLDHSFGQFPMAGSQEQRENLSIQKPFDDGIRFLERVFKVDKFQRLYRARMKEFSQTLFRPERFYQQVDEIAVAIRPAVQAESAEKLARFDKVVAGESVGPAGFGGGPPGGDRLIARGPAEGGGGPPFGEGFRGFGPPGAGGGENGPRFGPPGGFGFGGGIKPIKGFVTARAKSVNDQLAGKSAGMTIGGFGFGGPGGGPGGRGGPGGFGPGMFLGPIFLNVLDADDDGVVTRAEFTQGFANWFQSWNTDHSGVLSEDQLRAGIDKDLSPFRGGPPGGFGFPPGGPGFGPPPGMFGPDDGPEDP